MTDICGYYDSMGMKTRNIAMLSSPGVYTPCPIITWPAVHFIGRRFFSVFMPSTSSTSVAIMGDTQPNIAVMIAAIAGGVTVSLALISAGIFILRRRQRAERPFQQSEFVKIPPYAGHMHRRALSDARAAAPLLQTPSSFPARQHVFPAAHISHGLNYQPVQRDDGVEEVRLHAYSDATRPLLSSLRIGSTSHHSDPLPDLEDMATPHTGHLTPYSSLPFTPSPINFNVAEPRVHRPNSWRSSGFYPATPEDRTGPFTMSEPKSAGHKSLPPLVIPGSVIVHKATGSSSPRSSTTSASSDSAYSQSSASTRILPTIRLAPSSPPLPSPRMLRTSTAAPLPPLPYHLRYAAPVEEPSLTRGNTTVISQLLKSRAERTSRAISRDSGTSADNTSLHLPHSEYHYEGASGEITVS